MIRHKTRQSLITKYFIVNLNETELERVLDLHLSNKQDTTLWYYEYVQIIMYWLDNGCTVDISHIVTASNYVQILRHEKLLEDHMNLPDAFHELQLADTVLQTLIKSA